MAEKFYVLPRPTASQNEGTYDSLADALERMGGGLVVTQTGRIVAFHSNWDETISAMGAADIPPHPQPARRPFRFTGRIKTPQGDLLRWERSMPGDSRVEEMCTRAEWFYGQMLPTKAVAQVMS